MMFILVINSILLVISSLLKNTDLEDKNTYDIISDLTGNDYFFLLILLIFIFLSTIFSYSKVKTKVLMHFNYVSPYRIIYDTGIIGSIMTLIALIFVSFIDCKKTEKIQNYCSITVIENNTTKYYYDNINNYFEELYKNISGYKFYLEIFLIIPLFLVINFFGFVCETLTIYYLNPLYVLVRDNLYYCIQRFIFIFVNLNNFNNYITLEQFFILQTSEISALLGYSVYLEIIELRFCGLNKDLKRKIIERGERETIHKSNFINNEDNNENNDFDDSFIEENNDSGEKKEEELEKI